MPGVWLRALPAVGAQGTLVARSAGGAELGMRRLSYWGVRPSTWPHLLLRRPRAGGITPTSRHCIVTGPSSRDPALDPVTAHGPHGPGTVPVMDLAYPPEAEEFRTEIAGWLKENLPEGWGGPGFSMTP